MMKTNSRATLAGNCDRPGLFVRDSGKVGIVFGTGKTRRDDAGAGYVVSLTDELVLGRNNRLSFEAKPEWVMPLR